MSPPRPTEPTPAPAPLRRRDAALALGLAAALTALYVGPSDLLPGNDVTGSVYTAATLLATGQPTLEPERLPFLFSWKEGRPVQPYFLARVPDRGGEAGPPRFVNAYGLGAPLTALPVLAPLHLWAGDLTRRPDLLWAGARLAAALTTALAAALLFLAARRWLSAGPAAAVALLFALGTPAWSLSSQTLWQHPSDLLFLSLGAFALTRRPDGPGETRFAALSGLAFGAAATCRPQSAVFAVVTFLWLLRHDRRGAVAFGAGAAGPALLLLGWNARYLGGPLRFGQSEQGLAIALSKTGVADAWPWRLWESWPGLLLSPSRGLMVFSPFLAFSAWGAARAFRGEGYRALRPLALAVAALLVVEGAWFDWWGGWSYGWRRLLGLAPALTLLLVPLAGWLAARRWRRALLGALAAWAVAVQGLGALAYDLSGWNARPAWRMALPSGQVVLMLEPDEARAAQVAGAVLTERTWLDVDAAANRGRLWSVGDSMIPFTVRHFQALRRSRRDMAVAWVAAFKPAGGGAASR